jgi:hypothetical protein
MAQFPSGLDSRIRYSISECKSTIGFQHFHLLHLLKQVKRFFAGSSSAPIPRLPFYISGLVSKPESNIAGAEQVARHLLRRREQVGKQARYFPTIDDVKERSRCATRHAAGLYVCHGRQHLESA